MSVNSLQNNLASRDISIPEILQALKRIGFGDAPTLIHGSALTCNFDASSDVDLIVCVRCSGIHHLTEFCKSTRLDMLMADPTHLLREMSSDYGRGRDGLMPAIVDGVKIAGNWTALEGFARSMLERGPSKNTRHFGNRMAGLLSDMRRGSFSSIERILQASALLELLGDFHLVQTGQWSSGGPVLGKRLSESFPDLSEEMYRGMLAYVTSGRHELLDEVAIGILGIERVSHRRIAPDPSSLNLQPSIVK